MFLCVYMHCFRLAMFIDAGLQVVVCLWRLAGHPGNWGWMRGRWGEKEAGCGEGESAAGNACPLAAPILIIQG